MGKLLIFNTFNRELKEYEINLYLENANMHYYNDALYIIGGKIKKEYSTEPSSSIYKIDIAEFNITKMSNYK